MTYGSGYFEGYEQPSKFDDKIYRYVRRMVDKSEKVLDVGCGPGMQAEAICPADKGKYTGLDVSEVAIQKLEKAGYKGICQDAAKPLPFPDGSFDLIVCIAVMEHFLPHDAFNIMREFRRVLRPGGKVFIDCPSPHKGGYFWGDYTHIRPHTHGSLKHLSVDAGFERKNIRAWYSQVPCRWFKDNYKMQGAFFRLTPWWTRIILLEATK